MLIEETAYNFQFIVDKDQQREYIDSLNTKAWEVRKTHPVKSLEISLKAREFSGKSDYSKGIAYSYRNSGSSYYMLSQYQLAIVDLLKAYSLFNELGITEAFSSTFRYVGNVYFGLNNNEKAKQYYFEGLYHAEKHNNKRAIAYLEGNIALVFQREEKWDDAIEYSKRKLDYVKSVGDEFGMAEAMAMLGSLYLDKKDYVTSENFILRSLWISNKINYLKGIAENFINIGKFYFARKQVDEAIESLNRALAAAEELGEKRLSAEIYLNLSKIYEEEGNIIKALESYKLYDRVKTTILSFNNEATFSAMQVKFELEQTEKEKENYKLRNHELTNAYLLIESKNKDITDSIRYAKHLQEALLPADSTMNKLLKQYFLYYQPKDIVSGDFYFITEKKGLVYFAAIDCTGHGVPGAFMSIVCNNALIQAIRENDTANAAEILSAANILLSTIVKQKYEESRVRDGMDISLCIIDYRNNIMDFSGANQSLILIRNNEIIEIKGDKQPIGAFVGEELKPFINHKFSLEKNDVFYVFTDGYVDQFGGEEGGKIMRKRLRKLFIEHNKKPLNVQKDVISSFFNKWKGDLEQIDDVLVAGFRI